MVPPESSATGLVLHEDAQRVRLRALREALEARRDEIADLDLAIEDLLREVSDFERELNARLAGEYGALARVDGLVRTLERWRDLLEEAPREEVPRQAERLEARREAETRERRTEAGPDGSREAGRPEDGEAEADPVPGERAVAPRRRPPPDRDERLKTAYRSLARRHHPDLARTESERVAAGRTMARVNELYRLGDLARLEALLEQSRGGEVDEDGLDVETQVETLEARLDWFELVLENLREEQVRIEESPTCELMRRHEALRAAGRDLFHEIRAELRVRLRGVHRDVAEAARGLEEAVSTYNRQHATVRALAPGRRAEALDRLFDPAAGQALARLSLRELELDRHAPAARRASEALAEAVASDPARVRVVLLAWITELSPFPLPGLATWDDLAWRFARLGAADPRTVPLEQVLAELADSVEWGVRRATPKVARVGLRIRDPRLREAVPLALQRVPVRRMFKAILRVLADQTRCEACGRDVFPVPLFRSLGLDDLRATVCPECGATHARYWMPRGDDVQSLLNPAYLDLELVTEWGFRISRDRAATQLLPVEVDAMTVGDLKRRLHEDLFGRYGLELRRGQLGLLQGGRRVPEKQPLAGLGERDFEVAFAPDVAVTEAEAVELLRHRIRHRFQP